jgi:Glycosyl transferase family 90
MIATRLSKLVRRGTIRIHDEENEKLPVALIVDEGTKIITRENLTRATRRQLFEKSRCRQFFPLPRVLFIFVTTVVLINSFLIIKWYTNAVSSSISQRILFVDTESIGIWLFNISKDHRVISSKDSASTTNEREQSSNRTYEKTALLIKEYVMMHKLSSGAGTNNKIQNLEFAYDTVEEMLNRSNRFPSIEQRIKLYMSNWYIPPCDNAARVAYEYSGLQSPTNDNQKSTRPPTGRTLTIREITVQAHQYLDIKSRGTNLHRIGVQPALQEEVINMRRRSFQVNSKFNGSRESDAFDVVHFLDSESFSECKHKYCLDTIDFLLPSIDGLFSNNSFTLKDKDSIAPILYQFGDQHKAKLTQVTSNKTLKTKSWYPKIPLFQKMRRCIGPSILHPITDDTRFPCYHNGERFVPLFEYGDYNNGQNNDLRLEPIISKLKTQRHYKRIFHVAKAETTLWENKINRGIFRGDLTGNYPQNVTINARQKLSPRERCRLLERCWFTYTHASSHLIDSKISVPIKEKKMIPRFIDRRENKRSSNATEVDLYGDSMSLEEMLRYKAIIMLEGNDVSSGLKWALFSNSVVLMPEPTITSWAMEEMLVPWVHYVPIKVHRENDFAEEMTTDAEEKMQWIIKNDDKAKEIAKAGRLWIADLVLHPDVQEDEKRIFDEIARRYVTHFVPLALTS